MGRGLVAVLSEGAVPALWGAPPLSARWAGSRPVLQVVDVTRVPDGSVLRPGRARYRLLLSDGVYSQHATLSQALNPLAKVDDIRPGSVVCLHSFVNEPDPDHVRTVFITQLEILQTECALIGSLKLYKPKPPRNSVVSSTSRSMSCDLRFDYDPRFFAIQKGLSCGSYPSGGDSFLAIQMAEMGLSCGSYPSGGDSFLAIQMAEMGLSCGSYPSGGENLSVWKLVGQIKDENLGYSGKPDLITVKATISCVTELLCHVACPLVASGKQCNGMATGDVDGMWRCNVCGWCFSDPKYGCSVHIQIWDHTGTAFATMYEEAAEEILGCRAKDLYSMKYKEHDHAQLDDIIRRAFGKQYVFQLKVEQEGLFSGVTCTVLKAEKVNPSAESRRLLGLIDTFVQEGSGPGSEFRSPTMPAYAGS